MRDYEVVFLVHPGQSDQVPAMLSRYRELIEKNDGKIHRLEDWGRHTLAYAIAKTHKAHYVLMNIEVGIETLEELRASFHYNDAVLRHLIMREDKAITEESPIMRKIRRAREKERESLAARPAAENADAGTVADADADAGAVADADAQAGADSAAADAGGAEEAVPETEGAAGDAADSARDGAAPDDGK